MQKLTSTEIAKLALDLYDQGKSESIRSAVYSLCEKYDAPKKENIRKMAFKIRRSQENKKDLEENHKALLEECLNTGIPSDMVSHYWYKGKHFSMFVKPDSEGKQTLDDLIEEIVDKMNCHSPKYPKIDRVEHEDGHLLVIDPADIHIGKLATLFETGDEYNTDIAIQRVKDGVKGIVEKVQGFNIDQILLIIGNDILHVDTPKRTTTSGTPQDTDGMWYENFLLAKQLYVDVIETLISVADVHVIYNPSNHDYTNGFFLADVIKSWFRECPHITFDTSISHRKYYRYYNNLIGTTHGDGAKEKDLGLLMAVESKDWSEVKHRYFYSHHLHHKVSKDYIGLTVESLRSPSGTDSWHHRNGYQHVVKAVEGFLHSKEFGQIARITHIF